MLTRCPHCQTSFRVTSEQLKLRQGQVRCGECLGVFNALESLADEAVPVVPVPAIDSAAAEIPETPIVDAGDTPSEAVAEAQSEPDEPVGEAPAVADEMPPEEPSSVELPEARIEVPAEAPLEEAAAEPAAEPGEASVAAAELPEEAPAEEAVEDATEAEQAEDPPAPRRWPWIAGSLLLMLLAVVQLAYIYRVELAVLSPGLRTTMEGGCEAFGCSVPYPRKPELASIESSDLAPEDRDRLLLTATLKNRAPFVQEYPHLELTLTDARDAVILRKVLAPADYLPVDQPPAAGFAARSEVAVKLLLDAKDVPAVGYRLYLFYP